MAWCEEGERVNRAYAETARAVAGYQEFLRSVPRGSEERIKSEILLEANSAARRNFQEHVSACAQCHGCA